MSLRRTGIAIAALVAGLVVLLLLAHMPFARRAVLGYARSLVQRDVGLVLDAGRLDYNLATFRLGLAEVRVSAVGHTDEPFFESDYVAVRLSRGVLIGNVQIDDLALTNARVRLHRRADGSSNLPRSRGGTDEEPAAIPVARIDVARLAVDLVDEQADVQVHIPAMAVQLARDSGSISLAAPAVIDAAGRMTTIPALSTQATFDGRALRLTGGDLRSDEIAVQVNGTVLLIAREPSIELAVKGNGDIARLARWGIADGEVPEGTVAFDGRIGGSFSALRAELDLASARVRMGDIAVTDLSAHAVASMTGVDIESLVLGLASGRVQASASFPFAATDERRVQATWEGIDAAAATRLFAPNLKYVPAGASVGAVTAAGVGNEATGWRGELAFRLAGARNARGRLAAPGETTLTLRDSQWRLSARHALAGLAPLELNARGRLRAGQPLSAAVMDAGTVALMPADLPALLRAARTVGLADVDPALLKEGRLEARFELAGPLADPEASGTALLTELAGERFEVPSVTAEISGRPVRPTLTFELSGPEAIVSGQRVSDVRAAGQLAETAGPLRGPRQTHRQGVAFVVDMLSARQADGPGQLAGSATFELSTSSYTASIEGTDWQVVPTEDVPASGIVSLRFSGTGTTEAPRGDGDITVKDASWQGTGLGELAATVMLDGGPAALIEARAPDFSATASARVTLAAPHHAILDARADALDLARVLRGVETPTPIAGRTTASVHVEGALDAWQSGTALVEVTTLDATAGDLPVRLIQPARLRYEDQRIHLDRLEASAGETSLSAFGSLPAFEPDEQSQGLLLAVTGGVGEVARAIAATGISDVPLNGGTGPVALLARVTGSAQTPVVAADLEVGPGTISLLDLPLIANVVVRAHAGEGWVELREGVATYQQATVNATGRAPLSWAMPSAAPAAGGAELRAKATNLTAAVLSPFLDPSAVNEISGSLDASVEATSATLDLAALAGYLQIDRLDLRVADLPVTQRVPTRIVARDGFARVEAWDWVGQGATLAVQGQLRLEDRQAAFLANGVVDLRVLTPFVRDSGLALAGRAEPRLSITGVLDNPRIDGDVTLTDGEIRLSDPRVIVSDLGARAVLTRTSAHIASLTGSVNGGTLTGSGSLDFGSAEGLDAQLSTTIRGMAMEFPEGLKSEIDADLTLTGQSRAGGSGADPSGRITGVVTVVRGSYREPLAVVAGLLAGVRAQALTTGVAGMSEASPLLSALALDVRLSTDEDVIVDNNYGRLDLGADLRVIGTAAAPALAGRADLREGGRLFVGRNVYTIESGAIDFTNPVVIEPVLNIVANTRVGGEDIQVTITGSAESPMVALSSSSGLGEAEVAALLLTGRRLEDLPTDDAAFVGTQVLGNFSAEVLGFASRAVGLDTIRLGGIDTPSTQLDPVEAESEVDPTTRLTFGKSIGPNVNVTFSQSLRDSDAQAWIVDYMLRRGLELSLVSDDEDLRSLRFRHDISFGGLNSPVRPTVISQRASEIRVTAVTVSGDLAVVPETRVRGALRLVPGDRFDFGEWQDDRERLEELYHDLGYFTPRVTSKRSNAASEGVTLAYDVAPGPQTRIALTGLDLDSGLRSQLEDAWVDAVFDEFLTAEASDIIRTELARRGYLQSTVDARTRDEGHIKTLEIAVDTGARVGRTRVRIEGAPETLSGDIEAHLSARGLVEGVVVDPNAIEREAVAYLRALGYLRARVSAGVLLYERDAAVVPIQVDAGPVFTIARVSFDRATNVEERALREAAGIAEETPYDPGQMEGARNRVVALYRREGFAASAVTVRAVIREEAPLVDVTFGIVEGARDRVDEVVVLGNRSIDTDVVLRSLDLTVGDPLRTEELLQARTRLFNTGLFRRIDLASEPAQAATAEDGVSPIRLRVTVEEWPALRLRYGVLAAEEFRTDELNRRELVPGLSAEVSRRTLFGRAVTTGVFLDYQRRQQRGRVFLGTPTFFGLPIQSMLRAERSHEDFAGQTLVTNRTRFSWEQRWRLIRNLDLSYSYKFERNRTFETASAVPGFPALDIRINIARLNTAVAWDSRDDPSETTRGLLTSTSIEYAPRSLGSDIRFIRHVAQAYYFRPWRSVVFASAARVGNVVGLGGQDVIPSERFYSGGSRSVRGVAEDGLGPLFFFDNSPEGGEMLLILNQEVRFPIYKWLRGVTFVDVGNVFAKARDARVRDLVGAVGVGLRFSTPVALLRVDYAKTGWGDPADTKGRLIVGIGHAF